MPTIIYWLLATALFMLLHVSIMALCATMLGIGIRSLRYGIGPTLLTIDKVDIGLLPFAGNVVLKDTREQQVFEDDPGRDFYNEQPLWKQIAVPASGVAVLLALTPGILGTQGVPGWQAFTSAFAQIFQGALAPLGTAQQLLADGEVFARSHDFVAVFALVALKLCALNLLPVGGMNGGQIMLALARGGKPYAPWEEKAAQWLLLPGLAIVLSWLLALGWYCWTTLGAQS